MNLFIFSELEFWQKMGLRQAGGRKTKVFRKHKQGPYENGVWTTGLKKSCHWALSGNVLTQGWNEAFLIGLGKEL